MYRVLVVDDEPLVRQYMKTHIPALDGRWGEVDTAGDGVRALDLLKQNTYDLIITDIKMPGMDGLTLCRHIRDINPRQHIAILSGYDEFSFAKQALHYHVQEYLIKPVVKEELAALLQKTADSIRQQKEQDGEEQKQRELLTQSLSHMGASFLQALTMDLAVEVKNLYPILRDHGIHFIRERGAVMILDIDKDSMLQHNIRINESPAYRHMLSRMAAVLAGDGAYLFADREERCCLLVCGTDKREIHARAKKAYTDLCRRYHSHTGISLSGAVGEPVANVLYIKESYAQAAGRLENRLLGGSGFFTEQTEHAARHIEQVNQTISSIQSAVLDSDQVACRMAVDRYVGLFSTEEPTAIYRYGVHLAKALARLYPTLDDVLLNESADLMQSALEKSSEHRASKAVMEQITNIPAGHFQTGQDSEYDMIRQVQSYIQENFHRAISLDDVAQSVHVSVSYLSSYFHKAVGESYIQYLTRIRINEAAKLLRTNPQANVSDIAKKVGYVSPKHFSHVFKKHFTMPPGEYQRKYCANN